MLNQIKELANLYLPVRACSPLILCLLLPPWPTLADQYDYQDRGDRNEGIRPRPVSGDDIALISARAAPVGGTSLRAPERIRLSFVLPRDTLPAAVEITVRELDYRHYYWMDRVRPPTPWRPGAANTFRWPTRDVLGWLYVRGLRIDELGALVRLAETAAPSAHERVAPAVLSGDDQPAPVQSYQFTFKTSLPAILTCKVYAADTRQAILSVVFKRVGVDRPFSCQVPVAGLSRGDYRLEIDGYSLETNAPVMQEVRFFHDPDLQ